MNKQRVPRLIRGAQPTTSQVMSFVSKTMSFVSKARNCVSETRKFALNTMSFALNMMNSAVYRHPSGAFVFGGGTCQWSWGLDAHHDSPTAIPAEVRFYCDFQTETPSCLEFSDENALRM